MFGYIALIWDPDVPLQADTARRLSSRLLHELEGWKQVLASSGMSVFITAVHRGASRPYFLDHGVVLGTLFNRTDTTAEHFDVDLDVAQKQTILSSEGRELIHSYWGRYVAFLQDPRTLVKRIVRDPTGGMPCFWFDSNDCHICFSRLEDALQLEPRRLSINWETIAVRLAISLFHAESTGLNEVSELRAGECVCFHGRSSSRAFFWSPIQIASRHRLEDPALAAEALRHTAQLCTHAWASRYTNIIHYLSGGLDSAIVLACLHSARVRTPARALTYFSPGADSDERCYVRAAARKVDYELIELPRRSEIDLREISNACRTAAPVSLYIRVEASKQEAEVAASTGADGIFSGDGGDVLFFRTPGASTAVDYVRDHGPVPPALSVALNAACLDNVSVWIVLRDMWRYGVKRKRLHSLAERRSDWGAVSPRVVDCVTRKGDFVHPWFRSAGAVGPGKLRQAYLLSFAPDFYDPFDPGLPERASPLLSQPLIELCLQIPTYALSPGPQDRMLARKAFSADLPEEILYRVGKGSLARHVKQTLQSNHAFLAEFLLDSILVRNRLLDRDKLVEALSNKSSRNRYWAPELLEYAGVESWARSWSPVS